VTPVALTIAGSDPSGGAGLQADLKTFHQHRVYGTSVVTLLTVQNTERVQAVEVLAPQLVLAQLDAVLDDIPPHAAKTGALGNASIVEALADRARSFSFPLVVDPVMISTHGARLLDADAIDAVARRLMPRAVLVTPNLPEAALLAEMELPDLAAAEKAAAAIARRGAPNVLIKGGHWEDEPVDLLWSEGRAHWLPGRRFPTRHTHGSGCVLSAAIAARLARGEPLLAAVRAAKRFVTAAIQTSPQLGRGHGPLNLHAQGAGGGAES